MKIKTYVYIFSENVIGEVLTQFAFGAQVRYAVEGIEYEVFIDDSDYVELEKYYLD